MSALDTANLLRHDVFMANPDWQRLGSFVIARRMALGIKDRRVLKKISGLSDRTIGTLERGGSVNGATLGAIENALGWEPGSARRILEGGEPVIQGESAEPQQPRRRYDDPAEQAIWESIKDVRITGDPEEDERIKAGMIRYARAAQEDERRRAG